MCHAPSPSTPDAEPAAVARGVEHRPDLPRIYSVDRATRDGVFEFFTARLRTRHTRLAYVRAARDFGRWCDEHGLDLASVSPMAVAAYLESRAARYSTASQKLALAAIRSLFSHLVLRGIIPFNPADAVRGPRHVVRTGRTPVLDRDQARRLLGSIDGSRLVDHRDRALVSVLLYTWARASAVAALRTSDYFEEAGHRWFRFVEKGSVHIELPAHPRAAAALDEYLTCSGRMSLADSSPVFCSHGPADRQDAGPLSRTDIYRIVQRRAIAAGLPRTTGPHSLRATGITEFLRAGGRIERAQAIAGHASVKTTKLYDRTDDAVTISEIERVSY